MRSTNYTQINEPIKLHLEYDKMTVGELSNITRQWQALLRVAWRESYEAEHGGTAPNARVLTVAASTENSFELISEYAIPTILFATVVFGPVVNWPGLARAAYTRIRNRLGGASEREPWSEDRIYMRAADREINLPADVVADDETTERIIKLLKTLNSGRIIGTIGDTNPSESEEDSGGV